MTLEEFKSAIIPLRQNMLLVASKMLQNDEDAEDVVQESLLRLWSIRDQLDTVANPSGFAIQTVKNRCIDKLRIQRSSTSIENVIIPIGNETPDLVMERKEAVDQVKQIIADLPELQRQIIRMRDIEGYELEEIATITGTLITAVTMNLSRARKKVREAFFRIQMVRING